MPITYQCVVDGEMRYMLPNTQNRVTISLGLNSKTNTSQQMVFKVLKRNVVTDALRNCKT
jgi:hypothetical protein